MTTRTDPKRRPRFSPPSSPQGTRYESVERIPEPRRSERRRRVAPLSPSSFRGTRYGLTDRETDLTRNDLRARPSSPLISPTARRRDVSIGPPAGSPSGGREEAALRSVRPETRRSGRRAPPSTFGPLPGELAALFLREPGVYPGALGRAQPALYPVLATAVNDAARSCRSRASAAGLTLPLMCLDDSPREDCSLACRAAYERDPGSWEKMIIEDALKYSARTKTVGAVTQEGMPVNFRISSYPHIVKFGFGSRASGARVDVSFDPNEPSRFKWKDLGTEWVARRDTTKGVSYGLENVANAVTALSGGEPLTAVAFHGDLTTPPVDLHDAEASSRALNALASDLPRGVPLTTEDGRTVLMLGHEYSEIGRVAIEWISPAQNLRHDTLSYWEAETQPWQSALDGFFRGLVSQFDPTRKGLVQFSANGLLAFSVVD